MKKRVIVLSLGGSLIIPDNINLNFLRRFKKEILKNTKMYKFIIVCGGGGIARKYISALRKEGINKKLQSFSGISATRMNARFMNYFFNINPEQGIPHRLETLEKYLKKSDIVLCGALEYKPNQTTDSTAAELAKHFKTKFINITSAKGLYNKNPKKNKDAKLIQRISWKDFHRIAKKIKYKPGQHFILDQTASKIILKYKIPTYIIGKDTNQIRRILENRRFIGTLIEG